MHLATCGGSLIGPRRGHRTTGRPTLYQAVHSAVAGELMDAFEEAGIFAEAKTPGVLPASQRRPADILVLDTARLIAIDVRGVRLQTNTNQSMPPGSAVAREEEDKRQLSEAACTAAGVRFVPFAFDEFGHLGDCGRALLRALAERYAERARGDFRQGRDFAHRRALFETRWCARISYAVHSTTVRLAAERARRSIHQGATAS